MLALATIVVSSIGAVTQSRSELLGQYVASFAQRRIVEVSSGEELVAFDDPAFYDQLTRAADAAEYRPYQLASGLVALASGGFALIGLMAAMVFIAPGYMALALVAFVPLCPISTPNKKRQSITVDQRGVHKRKRH